MISKRWRSQNRWDNIWYKLYGTFTIHVLAYILQETSTNDQSMPQVQTRIAPEYNTMYDSDDEPLVRPSRRGKRSRIPPEDDDYVDCSIEVSDRASSIPSKRKPAVYKLRQNNEEEKGSTGAQIPTRSCSNNLNVNGEVAQKRTFKASQAANESSCGPVSEPEWLNIRRRDTNDAFPD